MKDSVKILGCRGSVPVSGPAFARYGGATSCVLVQLAGQTVILDAGTGLLSHCLNTNGQSLPVLLSHPHVDHLLGLPMCSAASDQTCHLSIWAKSRQGLGPEAQLNALMAPPLWPVDWSALPAAFSFHTIEGPFSLGPIRVDSLEGPHPGGVTLFRLTAGNKSIVYFPDCDLTELKEAQEFAQNCDLLLCDGQYSPEELATRGSFGHSAWTSAAQLGQRCGARQVRIIHHDPSHTDSVLDAAASQIAELCPNCTFAYEGEEITL